MNNRRHQIQKMERALSNKLNKTVKTFKDTNNSRQKIMRLIKELNDNGEMRIAGFQRTAKTRYLKEGQKNTKYFFNLNTNKYEPPVITGLLNKRGKLVTNTTTMCKIASKYHRELQSPPKRKRDNA